MSSPEKFRGFSKKTISFLKDLKKNNDKKWFDSHRKDYEAFVKGPSQSFVVAMGESLKTVSPRIFAVPKVNQSLFRINRDTRFSPDKSPYKTHVGIFFWEGVRPKMECPGFYFHIEPPKLILGVGFYMFARNQMDTYRKAVVDPELGSELAVILDKIMKLKNYNLGGKHYKRIPAPYDSSSQNAELLLFNGLHIGVESDIPEEFYSDKLIDYCWEKFSPLVPLHKWLVKLTG